MRLLLQRTARLRSLREVLDTRVVHRARRSSGHLQSGPIPVAYASKSSDEICRGKIRKRTHTAACTGTTVHCDALGTADHGDRVRAADEVNSLAVNMCKLLPCTNNKWYRVRKA